jgi:hypothetical protein
MVDRRGTDEIDGPGAVTLAAAAPADQGADYGAMTVAELQAELEARGLPTSGLKAELVQRLQDDDAAHA